MQSLGKSSLWRRCLGLPLHCSRWLACLLVVIGARPVWASFSLVSNGVVTQVYTSPMPDTLFGIVCDFSDNCYISDSSSNQIIKLPAGGGGAGTALAITGLSPALLSPRGLAMDSAQNLYIADTGNNRVVAVSSAGAASVISTSSLTLNSPQGVAVDVSGDIFISDTGNSQIIKVPAGGTAAVFTISGLSPVLQNQRGLAVDSKGNLYIADTGNSRVLKVSSTGTLVSTLTTAAGTALDGPSGVAVGNNGVIYVADTNTDESGHPTPGRVVIEDSQENASELLTGYPIFNTPLGIAVNPLGKIYVVDNGGVDSAGRLQSFESATINYQDAFTTAVGFGHVQLGSNGNSIIMPFDVGTGVTLSSISVYTAGTQNLDFTIANDSTCVMGSEYEENTPCIMDVTFSPTAAGLRKGALFFSYGDGGSLTVPLYGVSDAPVATLSPAVASVVNIGSGHLSSPFQSATDGAGNTYVTNYGANTVVRIPAGGGSATAVNTGSFTLSQPTGVALDPAGNLFIADYGNSRIIEVNTLGTASLFTLTGLTESIDLPTALSFDGAGNLFITDYGVGRIVEVNPYGQATVLGTGSITFATTSITGSTVDTLGNVYIADRTDGRIVKVDPLGTATVLSFTSVGALRAPEGVAVDPSGNVYVMDSSNQRIILVSATGATSVLPFSGVTIGSFIFGIALDGNSNVLVNDWSNNRLVKVNVGQSALTFANTNTGTTSSDSPKTALVTNLGDQPLVFSAAPTYTLNFPEDSSGMSPCTSSTTLATGTNCSVPVRFTPQTAGSLTANFTVTDNTLNVAQSTQQIALSGTGISSGDSTTTVMQPQSAVYGQPITIVARVADTASGHTSTVPTGAVTLIDTFGSTSVQLNNGSPVTLAAGAATLYGVLLHGIGAHSVTATYSGVNGSLQSSNETVTVTVSQSGVTITGPAQPTAIHQGQSYSVAVTVTGAYIGPVVPTGTVSYSIVNTSGTVLATAVVALSASSTASVPIPSTLAAGTYTILVTYSGDANYLLTSTATHIPLVIGKLMPAVTLVSSTNPSIVANPITFTATVAFAGGAPTGAVGFYDGTTLLGTVTLSSGKASFTTDALAVGTQSITADYSGDSNFASTTGAVLAELVQDFSISTPTSGTTNAPSATVVPGGMATYTLSIGPTAGTVFPAPVTLSLSGLPPGATGTLSPQTLPAGSSLSNVTLTIQLPQQTAQLGRTIGWLTPAFALLLLPFSGRMRRRAKGWQRLALVLLAVAASAGATVGLLGCGAKSTGFFGQPATSYTVLITATSGSLSHSTSVTLNVE